MMQRIVIVVASALAAYALFVGWPKEDIFGHWHLYNLAIKEEQYLTLDIENDTTTIIGKHSLFGAVKGRHFPRQGRLEFPGECGSGKFSYWLVGDSLYLKNELSVLFGGIRCQDSCCDIKQDIKNETRVDIQLFMTGSMTMSHSELPNVYLWKNIFYGYVKNDPSYSPGRRKLELDGKFAQLDEVPFWMAEGNRSIPNHFRSRVYYRIFTDESACLSDIMPIIESIENRGVDKVFLPFFNDNTKQFSYWKLDTTFTDRDQPIADLTQKALK